MGILEECDIENYGWRLGIVKKSLWILLIFLVWWFMPPSQTEPISWDQNMLKLVFKQYVKWKYCSIFA